MRDVMRAMLLFAELTAAATVGTVCVGLLIVDGALAAMAILGLL